MKNKLQISHLLLELVVCVLLLIVAALLLGCSSVQYETPEGMRYKATSLFMNAAIKQLQVGKETKTTKTGLSIGSVEQQTATEALEGITEAIVRGAIQGAKNP